jgi:iron complex transport system substrate-binding protein
MIPERIISFLPSATELIYELGAQDSLFGVTHECLYPSNAKTKPRVISSVFDPILMSSREIDDKINELMKNGKEIYNINEKNIIKAKPDLIISQDVCEVCSAHTNQVNYALSILEKKPQVYTMNPHNLDEILFCIKEISKKIGKEDKGNMLVDSLEKRIDYIKNKKFENWPSVIAIEWIDPLFTSGHWIPQMVETAGGKNLISSQKERSRKMGLDELKKIDPDIIIMMPCGFDVDRTIKEYGKILAQDKEWNSLKAVQEGFVFAVDANSYFSKPSFRTITGIEILAKIIHPEIFGDIEIPENSFEKIN